MSIEFKGNGMFLGEFVAWYGRGSTEPVSDEIWVGMLEYREQLRVLEANMLLAGGLVRSQAFRFEDVCRGYDVVLTMVYALGRSIPKIDKAKHLEIFFDRMMEEILAGANLNAEECVDAVKYIEIMRAVDGAKKALNQIKLSSEFGAYLRYRSLRWVEPEYVEVKLKSKSGD